MIRYILCLPGSCLASKIDTGQYDVIHVRYLKSVKLYENKGKANMAEQGMEQGMCFEARAF